MALDFGPDFLFSDRFVETDKFRAYNLLISKAFIENPAIGIDVAGMIAVGIDVDSVDAVLIKYLNDFGVVFKSIQTTNENGALRYNLEF
ncbi:MAG: hypothetical protein ACRCZM_08690 [Bacteroidales bacterium]